MKKIILIAAVLLLAGCSTISGIITASTTAPPSQATTIAEATQAATLAENAIDLYVKNGNPNQAVLGELKVLVPAVHNALVAAEAANKSGNSALAASALSAFNQAYAAYQAYAVQQGVSK